MKKVILSNFYLIFEIAREGGGEKTCASQGIEGVRLELSLTGKRMFPEKSLMTRVKHDETHKSAKDRRRSERVRSRSTKMRASSAGKEKGRKDGRFVCNVRTGRRIAHTCTRDRPTDLTRVLTYGCTRAGVHASRRRIVSRCVYLHARARMSSMRACVQRSCGEDHTRE